ncbi:MMPL family transporter [Bacillus testis]|uniref:MMPL family transporter n=1 Tax=Bacillus testis TaxID=1622072 RepID=UPI00067E7AD2|nr:MMPL family transporter [Bacillus testis]
MEKLARRIITYYKFFLIIWILLACGLAFYAIDLPSKLKGDGFEMEGEYKEVQEELSQSFNFPENTLFVVFERQTQQSETDFKKNIDAVLKDIDSISTTSSIVSPLETKGQYKKDIAYALLNFDRNDEEMKNAVRKVREVTDSYKGTSLTGQAVISEDMNEASQHDLKVAEMIGLPVALIVLLFAFGSLVAAVVPIVVGALTVVLALGILTLLEDYMDLSVFLLNVTPMIGLALSIDFALLFINRYKEEADQMPIKEAVIHTMGTAGKSILFSALCVFIGLAAMLVIDIDIFQTVAIGGMVVVAVAVISSLTLLPSILLLLGERLYKGKVFKNTNDSSHKWRSFAEAVMKRPIIITVIATLILLAGILPIKDIVLSIPDEQSLPATYDSRAAFTEINDAFHLKKESTVYMIAERKGSWDSQEGLKDLKKLIDHVESESIVKSVDSLFSISKLEDSKLLYQFLQSPEGKEKLEPAVKQFIKGDQLLLPVTLDAESQSKEAKQWVKKWSLKHTDFHLKVGGEAKFNQEIFEEITNKVGYGIALVLISTYLILMFAFRSAIIPLKAIIMNILGLTSTFGILVWIFQEGHFGLQPMDIALIIPVFVFSIVFGLSMDYEVFLISRIHEEYLRTGDNDEATVSGLASTSKIITSAALIMIVLTGAFAFTGVVPVKQIGIGIALAIFVDATIIRLLLVPSLMKLLGDWNWWLPFSKHNPKSLKKKA